MVTVLDKIFELYPLHAQRIIEEMYKQQEYADYVDRWLSERAGPSNPLGWVFRWKVTAEGHMYWAALYEQDKTYA